MRPKGSIPRVSRVFTRGWFVSDGAEFAGLRLDGEDGGTVVSSVRAVEELAGRMHLDFGGPGHALKVFWHRGDGLDLAQDPWLRIIIKGGYG